MKKEASRFLFMLFCIAAVTSCSNDDELQLTGINGKPSSMRISTDEDRRVFFSYQGNRLFEIKEIKGSILKFEYENNELTSVSTSPEDKEVADGHGYTNFKKNGNKISIESWGEPSFDVFRQEIELNEHNIPVKITDIGLFGHAGTDDEISMLRDGEYYGMFTYDRTTQNLIRLTIYNKATSEETAIYNYEYDSNPGVMSAVDLPLWFYAHREYGNRAYRYGYSRIFFNYSNNIVKETVTEADNTTGEKTFNYFYQYNKEDTPVSMKNDGNDTGTISITY